jgi:hypothetical protein
MRPDCPRAVDVVQALTAGAARPVIDAELAAHLARCTECAELLAVATAVAEAARGSSEFGAPPLAGQVWWRTHIRARAEARAAAERPITIVTAVATASVLGLVIALMALVLPQLVGPASDLTTASLALRLAASPLTWLALGAWALLAPTALYLALRE